MRGMIAGNVVKFLITDQITIKSENGHIHIRTVIVTINTIDHAVSAE